MQQGQNRARLLLAFGRDAFRMPGGGNDHATQARPRFNLIHDRAARTRSLRFDFDQALP
jgi:hypothetical protein